MKTIRRIVTVLVGISLLLPTVDATNFTNTALHSKSSAEQSKSYESSSNQYPGIIIEDSSNSSNTNATAAISSSDSSINTTITKEYSVSSQPIKSIEDDAIDDIYHYHSKESVSSSTIEEKYQSSVSLCSCSPTVYNIRLDFSTNCAIDTLKNNAGIQSTLCLLGGSSDVPTEAYKNVADKSSKDTDVGTDMYVGSLGLLSKTVHKEEDMTNEEGGGLLHDGKAGKETAEEDTKKNMPTGYHGPSHSKRPGRSNLCRRLNLNTEISQWSSVPSNDEFFQKYPELKSHQEDKSTTTRRLQLIPSRLISAQFLEFDTSQDMNIINQDDQYLDVTLPLTRRLAKSSKQQYKSSELSDKTLSYTSISSTLDTSLPLEDQLDKVPGGVILILIGTTEDGEVLRNRLLWTYTTSCGEDGYVTVENGDQFGWSVFVSNFYHLLHVHILFLYLKSSPSYLY